MKNKKIAIWCMVCRQWTTIKISEDAYTNWKESGDGRSLRVVDDEHSHLLINGTHKDCVT